MPPLLSWRPSVSNETAINHRLYAISLATLAAKKNPHHANISIFWQSHAEQTRTHPNKLLSPVVLYNSLGVFLARKWTPLGPQAVAASPSLKSRTKRPCAPQTLLVAVFPYRMWLLKTKRWNIVVVDVFFFLFWYRSPDSSSIFGSGNTPSAVHFIRMNPVASFWCCNLRFFSGTVKCNFFFVIKSNV